MFKKFTSFVSYQQYVQNKVTVTAVPWYVTLNKEVRVEFNSPVSSEVKEGIQHLKDIGVSCKVWNQGTAAEQTSKFVLSVPDSQNALELGYMISKELQRMGYAVTYLESKKNYESEEVSLDD